MFGFSYQGERVAYAARPLGFQSHLAPKRIPGARKILFGPGCLYWSESSNFGDSSRENPPHPIFNPFFLAFTLFPSIDRRRMFGWESQGTPCEHAIGQGLAG